MAKDEFGAWQTDLCITGMATPETIDKELEGAYLEVSLDKGQVFAVLSLLPGQHFDDEPLHLKVVN